MRGDAAGPTLCGMGKRSGSTIAWSLGVGWLGALATGDGLDG